MVTSKSLFTQLSSYLPKTVVERGHRYCRLDRKRLRLWEMTNPFLNSPEATAFSGPLSIKFGITYDLAQGHVDYLKACQNLGASYQVINLLADDWIDQMQESGIDALLVRPTYYTSLWKQVFDERLKLLKSNLNIPICPSVEECWLYESKRRIRDWLVFNNFSQPKTSVFLTEDDALQFLRNCKYPIVFKSDIGAAAFGVRIVDNEIYGRKIVKRVFSEGISTNRSFLQERQWGCVMFQEYIEDAREWRMVRIGDWYFCREKLKGKDGLHSGSGSVRWAKPDARLLDKIKQITDAGQFTSMNVDFFEDRSGNLFVNELHAYFGAIKDSNQSAGEEHKGRWTRSSSGGWQFDPGYFYHNSCANLRVKMMIDLLGKDK